jgi:hypothetical protein
VAAGVPIPQWVIPHVRISVKVLRVPWLRHNRVSADEATQGRVVVPGPIIHQSRAFVKLLAGEGVVSGQGVVGAGTDGAPRVVALSDGLLTIGTVAHIRGAEVVDVEVVLGDTPEACLGFGNGLVAVSVGVMRKVSPL